MFPDPVGALAQGIEGDPGIAHLDPAGHDPEPGLGGRDAQGGLAGNPRLVALADMAQCQPPQRYGPAEQYSHSGDLAL
ncbi:MAG TPA: hypothetical protein PLL69_12755 [Gemmatimonadales bacterium]|nr:hypothetical protein [Gemmatimonadales bacterium]